MFERIVWSYPKVKSHLAAGSISFILVMVGWFTIPKNDLPGLFMVYSVVVTGMLAVVLHLIGFLTSRKAQVEINAILEKRGYSRIHHCQIYLPGNFDSISQIEYNNITYSTIGSDASRIHVWVQSDMRNKLWFIEIMFCATDHSPKSIGIVVDGSSLREYVFEKQ